MVSERQTGPDRPRHTVAITRRQAFIAATAVLNLPLGRAASDLGVTYNHLMLVLDGTRRGSAMLEAGIRATVAAARPALKQIIAGEFDIPGMHPNSGNPTLSSPQE